MSNLIKGEGPPLINIGMFEPEAVTLNQPAASSANTAYRNGPSSYEDSSVSSWDLPVVDRECDSLDKREDFKTRIARIEKEAYGEGFEQGQKDGLALEAKKMEEMAKQLEKLFTGLRDLKSQIYAESEGELLKMVFPIVKKIIGEEVKTDGRIIGNTVRSALKFSADKRRVKIIINPDDMEEVKKLLPDLAKLTKGGHFQLTEDNCIEKGGCVLETGFGKINATIEDQLSVLEEEIEKEFRSHKANFHETLS